ncbi:polyprenyl synthetase family protein, partial [Pseudomonas aeruginosa]|nr:polyprenyl synthetase family protein [Pseudomonas aeruginosa]
MIAAYQARCQARVDAALDALFVAPREELQRLYEAMRYSVMNGGKRVRPLLAYAACEALGGAPQRADAAACAVELIHAYSLVHDDLPAMDDDDLRRGQPTTHRAFDEATAILAADGLQALAFEVLADTRRNPQEHAVCLEMLTRLARAAGSAGMVGGQAIDLGSVGVALAGRSRLEMQGLVGCFVNLLPLAVGLRPGQSAEWRLRQVGHDLLELLEHQDVPLECVTQAL